MKNVVMIYDDRRMPSLKVSCVTGDKSFGETIVKRVPLAQRIKQSALRCKNVCDFIILEKTDGLEKINQELINSKKASECRFAYMYSNYGLRDEKEFVTLLEKAAYADGIYLACCGQDSAMVLLPDRAALMENADALEDRTIRGEKCDNDAFTDLAQPSNFLRYITGGFDARFFNVLEGDAYTVTKRSNKVEKIKSEYKFYGMLPDNMKKWFVMPYDYKEDGQGASYTMERINTTDIAIRFVHGAVSTGELQDILDQLFYFLKNRQSRKEDAAKCEKTAQALYVTKVRDRMKELSSYSQYKDFDNMVRLGTDYDGIDDVVDKYEKLYAECRKKAYQKGSHAVGKNELVIGHGDLCFSNILYSSAAGLLKLIDPKGALTEDDMYTDPYYDIAKLSHSICGGYDFFNSGLYQLALGGDLKWHLELDADLEPYKRVFTGYLEKEGYDASYVRICEAGLFLSMLPYHMDMPGKVFGFLLNAIRIMDEVRDAK